MGLELLQNKINKITTINRMPIREMIRKWLKELEIKFINRNK